MKIAIIGYSGSGKSTLARKLAGVYDVEVLHLDAVHFLSDWIERPREDERRIVSEFLDKNTQRGWVIDGTYSKVEFERRMQEADEIIFLNFNRFSCLFRAWKRYKKYKGKTRGCMAEGCDEKFDWAFLWWILWQGREKKRRKKFENVIEKYPEKVCILKNQRQLDGYVKQKNTAESL